MHAQQQDEARAAATQRAPLPEVMFRKALEGGDEAAILRAACHNPAHFAPIYSRHFPRVYAYCLRRTVSACEAEDLTSQIFIHALKNLSSFRGGLVSAWLFRIARSVVANHFRSQHYALPFESLAEILPAEDPPMLEAVELTERVRSVREMLCALPSDERELIALRVDAGLTSEEIGRTLGIRAGTVRIKLHRIFKRLQTQLAEDES